MTDRTEHSIDRGRLLSALEAVRPCLAARDTIEQSSRFCFKGGLVYAFDEEAGCRGPSGLPDDFEGAVGDPKRLVDYLKRTGSETLTLTCRDGEFRLRGRASRDRVGVEMDPDFRLPVDSVESPAASAWRPLPDDFCEAAERVARVAGKDDAALALTCVHLTPDWAEATDGAQMARWKTAVPLSGPVLLRQRCVAAAAALGASEVAETAAWVHFRNSTGFVLSCRRYDEPFPTQQITLEIERPSDEIELPRELDVAADFAGQFAADSIDGDSVEVQLTTRRLEVTGAGVTSWYSKSFDAYWSGPDVTFLVAPKILKDIARNHTHAQVGRTPDGAPRCLRVQAGPYCYATALYAPQDGRGEADE